MDLTGIINQNAFYAEYYLQSLVADDLGKWVKDRRAKVDGPFPWDTLQKLGSVYRQAREDYRTTSFSEDRLEIQRSFLAHMLNALEFNMTLEVFDELERGPLPLITALERDQQRYLWVVEAFDHKNSKEDVMTFPVHTLQTNKLASNAALLDLVRDAFFMHSPPRWILIASLDQLVLYDRNKWADQQALRFDWSVLYGGHDTRIVVFQLIAMLLCRTSLVPDGGTPSMIDHLATQSQKHNQGISSGLKYALREAVELLGQEYIRHHPRVDAEALTNDCLRYLYRLLFLFTVEARQHLGYLPMNAELYREGFSLEKLRDLEQASLHEEDASEGFFIHDSLMELFDLIYQGRQETGRQRDVTGSLDTFSVAPLKCDLFDIEHTPLLSKIKIRNGIWQKIIQSMSMGKTRKGLGRISYAQLGINHLGEVYEALLSYKGFIAKEKLYEVQPKNEKPDPLKPAYFVNEEELRKYYSKKEHVYNDDGSLVTHEKGTFIYRLTGRAKETSASYYTPESLTQCVVKYALKEIMADKTADELLKITICEPAMGSAAFLNEAISQLAQAYLDRKTKERNEKLPPSDYVKHLQRIKLYLADNNVYGVDLNPIAVELGGVSLWLNTLVPGGFVPWFGNQLWCGNALMGAWRSVYHPHELRKKKWWEKPPKKVQQCSGDIYHFLVGDRGMAHYPRGVIKELAKEKIALISEWKKRFTNPLSTDEINRLRHLSGRIDDLWARHLSDLRRLEVQTTDHFPIYPEPIANGRAETSTRHKENLLNSLLNNPQGAYQRLKLVMDYWCSLWFWPIDKADLLPTRAEFINDIGVVLAGRKEAVAGNLDAVAVRDELGDTDMSVLLREQPRLRLVQELADREKFLHWQLVFADQFADRGGFDLVIGNPPWLKNKFVEKAVMGDVDARFAVKKLSAPETAELRQEWVQDQTNARHYTRHYESAQGQINFLNATQSYPLLKGMQTNLYKSFITRAWALSHHTVGLLHPGGVYDDAKGGRLREAIYPRLRYRFKFTNQLFLFPDAGDRIAFSVNIYGPPMEDVSFVTLVNLFDPHTVDASFAHDGYGRIPGIKNDNNKWNLAGHKARLIRINREVLETYTALYDNLETPILQARLPNLHCAPFLAESVRILAKMQNRIENFRNRYYSTQLWHETNAPKDGIIRKETCFTENLTEWIVSGPHLFVGNPLYKTPNRICTEKAHYTRLDLTTLPIDYRPRTKYLPDCEDYQALIPVTPWKTKASSTYRIGMRVMFGAAGERSLIAAVLPPEVGHTNALYSIAFKNVIDLLQVTQGLFTIVVDFLTKISGKTNAHEELWERFPAVPLNTFALSRILGLTCLTQNYADLWNDPKVPRGNLGWSRHDHRLNNEFFESLTTPWSWNSPLRTDYARWQAQIELDVLFAQACGLTLQQLCTMYQMNFPVLQNYEKDTWYDKKGRIIFSDKSGEGILPRKPKARDTNYSIHTPTDNRTHIALGWEEVKNLQEGEISYTFMDDTLPGGPTEKTVTCHAPFDRCNREEAYAEAWEFFKREQST